MEFTVMLALGRWLAVLPIYWPIGQMPSPFQLVLYYRLAEA